MSTTQTKQAALERAITNGHDEDSLVPQFIDFDSSPEPTEVKFKYKGEDFVLVEASHPLARKWRSAALAAHIPTADGGLIPGPKFPETDVILVAGCVFKVNAIGGREPVDEKFVLETFPNRVTKKLYETARHISFLTERDLSTPELVEKEIARLERMLAKIRKEQQEANGGPAGNWPESGKANSA